jgi:hypothetical protein
VMGLLPADLPMIVAGDCNSFPAASQVSQMQWGDVLHPARGVRANDYHHFGVAVRRESDVTFYMNRKENRHFHVTAASFRRAGRSGSRRRKS